MQSTYDKIQYYKIDNKKKAAIISKLKALLDREDIKLAWLFGSITRHDTVRDIDVAIYTDPALFFSDYLNFNSYIEMKLGLPVDLVEIVKVPASLKEKIFREGILIVGTKSLQEKLRSVIF